MFGHIIGSALASQSYKTNKMQNATQHAQWYNEQLYNQQQANLNTWWTTATTNPAWGGNTSPLTGQYGTSATNIFSGYNSVPQESERVRRFRQWLEMHLVLHVGNETLKRYREISSYEMLDDLSKAGFSIVKIMNPSLNYPMWQLWKGPDLVSELADE